MRGVTKRQAEALGVIVEAIEERGIAPTLREICAALGLASTHAASQHLDRLVLKGLITRVPIISRGLQVTALGRRVYQEQKKGKGA